MQIRSVGIDLGKTTFHLVALGDNGKVLLKKKFIQKQLITFTANLQTLLIGMEACSGESLADFFESTLAGIWIAAKAGKTRPALRRIAEVASGTFADVKSSVL